ncbi:MAG TPA: cytochrome c3 family protein [Bryobacteraceae bacterium]|nr:cytochrome c3 family protein [Bryobacteraceae bacterium]
MAHYLQSLILLGWLAAVAPGADFSHALHLKLKPDCLSCHTRAASSTKVEDNLLPAAEACASCHTNVQIKQPRRLRVKAFSHAFHGKMGNVAPVILGAVRGKTYLGTPPPGLDTKNACAGCHHAIEQSTAASKAHFPQMADCLVCHNKIDPPFSCETCHGADKTLKPVFHTNTFLDSHTRKSVKEGCAVCHGRKFTCLGCH